MSIKHKKINNFNNLKRTQFRPPNGLTISQLKNKILEFQSELAVAIRQRETLLISKLIKRITRSKLSSAWAVYQTISSQGARSRGYKDTKRPSTTQMYKNLMNKIWKIIKYPNSYKAKPLNRVFIPKPAGGFRPISVPTYLDRALQQLFLIILDVFQEEQADHNSFGFRKFRSPGWASKATTLTVWQTFKTGVPEYVIELDIEKCFDKISHDFIMANVATVTINGFPIEIIPTPIIYGWLKQGFMDSKGEFTPKDQFNPTEEGVPQGGPISPIISNMVLNGLEGLVRQSQITLPPVLKIGIANPDLLKKNDRLEWSFKGHPILCTFNCTQPWEIDYAIKSTPYYECSYNPAIASYLLRGAGKSRINWSYTRIQGELNPFESSKLEQKTLYARLIRYADDCILFVRSIETRDIMLLRINEFLKIRGLQLNAKKTFTKKLSHESFTFTGYEFRLLISHGKFHIYNFPPKKKVLGLLNKIKTSLDPKESPYTNINKLNSILNGWLNYYRCANSKNCFIYIKFRLFHLFRKYLFKFMARDKRYKKEKKILSTKLYQVMWRTYLIRQKDSYRTEKWWGLSKKNNPSTGRYKNQSFMLINPSTISVATPSIITGLNAYHPLDRIKLMEKSIKWKWGLSGKLLERSKGLCSYCGCSLTDDNTIRWQIHHIKPLKRGGSNEITNLKALCTSCHKIITKAENNLDPILIPKLVGMNLLTASILDEI